MARDVELHCRECQQAKLPAPDRAPLTSMPVGRPWQMLAVDILEVPVSYKNNRYLLSGPRLHYEMGRGYSSERPDSSTYHGGASEVVFDIGNSGGRYKVSHNSVPPSRGRYGGKAKPVTIAASPCIC